jgi:hypothetical protein
VEFVGELSRSVTETVNGRKLVWLATFASGALLPPSLGRRCLGAEVPTIALKLERSTTVNGLPVAPFQVPIKCDSAGNLYVRVYQDPSPMAAPIRKISAHGELLATFSFDHVGALEPDLQALDFVVGSRGEVFAVAEDGKGRHLVKFRSGGELQSTTTLSLSPDFDPYRFARLGSGFLITTLKGNERMPTIFVIDESGGDARSVNMKEGFQADRAVKMGSNDAQAFELSDMVTDESGRVYLMRPSTPARVVVFSPAGDYLKKFDIDRPGADYEPVGLAVGAGTITVVFHEHTGESRSRASELYRIID